MAKYTAASDAVPPAGDAGVAPGTYPQHLIQWTSDGAVYTSTENASGVIAYRPAISTMPIPAGRGRA